MFCFKINCFVATCVSSFQRYIRYHNWFHFHSKIQIYPVRVFHLNKYYHFWNILRYQWIWMSRTKRMWTIEKYALGYVCSHGKMKNIVNGDFLCFRNICVILWYRMYLWNELTHVATKQFILKQNMSSIRFQC